LTPTSCLFLFLLVLSFIGLYQGIINSEFDVALTTEILIEYEEIIFKKWLPDVAKEVIRTLIDAPNVFQTGIYYNLNLISTDSDDNKFVDCAFASNAHYLVSNDKHLMILHDIPFPKIPLITIQEFKKIYNSF
jgi:uncharacterized protein